MPKDMEGVMDEFKSGKLHSGSSRGPVVRDRKQAIAVGLSEQREIGKKVQKPKDHLHNILNKVGDKGTGY